MWFFMISIYVLSLLTFGLLFVMLVQGFNVPLIVTLPPPLIVLLLASIVYSLTETLVIFFFVGTGVSVRDYSQEHNLPDDYRKRSLAIKYRLYPPTMLNILLMVILFVLPGAVHAGKVPWIVYQYYFFLCLGHFVYTKLVQHACFRENTENILAMSGVKRPA